MAPASRPEPRRNERKNISASVRVRHAKVSNRRRSLEWFETGGQVWACSRHLLRPGSSQRRSCAQSWRQRPQLTLLHFVTTYTKHVDVAHCGGSEQTPQLHLSGQHRRMVAAKTSTAPIHPPPRKWRTIHSKPLCFDRRRLAKQPRTKKRVTPRRRTRMSWIWKKEGYDREEVGNTAVCGKHSHRLHVCTTPRLPLRRTNTAGAPFHTLTAVFGTETGIFHVIHGARETQPLALNSFSFRLFLFLPRPARWRRRGLARDGVREES